MPDHRGAQSVSPEGLTPAEIESAQFGTSFRGYTESEVKAFLSQAAAALSAARARVDELERELAGAPAVAPSDSASEEEMLAALGEETAAVLRSAREAAADLRSKAEQTATRLVSEAHEEAEAIRSSAQTESDSLLSEAASVLERRTAEAESLAESTIGEAEERASEVRDEAERYAQEHKRVAAESVDSEIAAARSEGVRIVDGARRERQEVLDDLARRRALLAAQIEELRRGRDQLIDAFGVVKRTFLDATAALAQVEQIAAGGGLVVTIEGGEDPALVDDVEMAADVVADDLEPPEFVTGAEPMSPAAGSTDEAVDATTVEGPTTPQEAPTTADEPDREGVSSEIPADDTDEEPASAKSRPSMEEVDSLFERLRAAHTDVPASDRSVEDASGTDRPDAPSAASSVPPREDRREEPEDAGDDMAIIERRDDLVAELAVDAIRRAKRAVQDEQNELLDAVRRHKRGLPESDEVLESDDDYARRWSAVLADDLEAAYGAGAQLIGAQPGAFPDSLGPQLATQLVAGLRSRLADAVSAAQADPEGDTGELLELLGARYREWKAADLEAGVRAVLLAACARGCFDAAPAESTMRWVVPPDGCSPDCLDNALEPTGRGAEFPTGHLYPPAYDGCRCIAIPQSALVATGGGGGRR